MSGRRSGTDDGRYRADGGREPDDLTDLEGIGAARADKLRDAGFESVADLRDASRDDVADVLGPDLADRILGQLPAEAPPDESEPTDESGSANAGPTVPSADEGGESGGSGPAGTDDSGPSVPSGSGGESDAGGEPGGQVDQASSQSGQAGGGGATGGSGGPTTGTGGTGTGESTAQQGGAQSTSPAGSAQATNDSNEDAILAGLVSFLIPGLGNLINGQTDRGVIILVIWILWLVVGWGIGLFVIGSIVGVLTLGIGFVLIGLVVGLMEFLIHILAAVDAYRGSKVVDNVTGKVNEVRGN